MVRESPGECDFIETKDAHLKNEYLQISTYKQRTKGNKGLNFDLASRLLMICGVASLEGG